MSELDVARYRGMPETSAGRDAFAAPFVERRRSQFAEGEQALPPMPRRIEDTGLELLFLAELCGKLIFLRGKLALSALANQVALPPVVLNPVLDFMRAEHLAEVARRGSQEGDVEYQLTEEGKRRAIESLQRCQYVGPAPVTLADYTREVERHSIGGLQIRAEMIKRVFADLIVAPEVLDQFGAAMNSGRAIFVYGPAGSGKTYLAERLCRLLGGAVGVPHALRIDGEIIQIFDPLVHRPLADREHSATEGSTLLERRHQLDRRWVLCERPVVMTGGELTLAMLDLHFDAASRFYQAPPHLKANNGIFIVDDLGRQLVAPRDLMNRWIVPLDQRCDFLALHTGYKFRVPFDVLVVMSTNLRPTDLADEAFLRRLGYKIHLGPVAPGAYRQLCERYCASFEVTFDRAGFDVLVEELHGPQQRPLLACYPRDLIGMVRDFALYDGVDAALTPSAVRRAWAVYFVPDRGADSTDCMTKGNAP